MTGSLEKINLPLDKVAVQDKPDMVYFSYLLRAKEYHDMNKDVLIKIKGLQHEYTNIYGNGVQTIQRGQYKKVSGRHIVTYEELPGSSGITPGTPVKNLLKIDPDAGSVSLTKRGQTSTDMLFKEGYYHTGIYETAFGTLQAGFITSRLVITEEADCINIQIDYGLELNYSHISDCTVYINICSV